MMGKLKSSNSWLRTIERRWKLLTVDLVCAQRTPPTPSPTRMIELYIYLEIREFTLFQDERVENAI